MSLSKYFRPQLGMFKPNHLPISPLLSWRVPTNFPLSLSLSGKLSHLNFVSNFSILFCIDEHWGVTYKILRLLHQISKTIWVFSQIFLHYSDSKEFFKYMFTRFHEMYSLTCPKLWSDCSVVAAFDKLFSHARVNVMYCSKKET